MPHLNPKFPLLALLGLSLVWLAVLALWRPLETLDHRLGDKLMAWDAAGRMPPDDIILINIDQNSLDNPEMLDLAGNWPWPRSIHGELLNFLGSRKPAAIIFDLTFTEPDRFQLASDRVLETALKRYPAYLPLVVTDGTPSRLADLPPIMGARPGTHASPQAALPLLAPKALSPEVWRTGLINFLADVDGVSRRYWLHFPHAGWTLPSLPARVAQDLGMVVPENPDLPLHFYGRPFRQISYAQIFLESLKQHPTEIPELEGKILIIGAAAPGLHDLRPTPFSASTPGPQIMATALANLARGDYLRPLSSWYAFILGTLAILGISWATLKQISPLYQGVWLAAMTLACPALAAGFLKINLVWEPYSTLLAVWLYFACCALGAYLRERRQREHALRMFGRFLDPRVVQSVTDGNVLTDAQVGRSREITVLFSDIRGFTSLSENQAPETIVHLLNHYFETQVEAIFSHGGTLDKFIGDAIMAFWGAPALLPEHPVHAVQAALEMQERLETFKNELGAAYGHFDIGIGIHTGPAVVGFLGTSRRLEYTAIGDTVNLASRIEGLTKGVSRILISLATRNACQQLAPDYFEFIDRGEARVKGREQPVRLFEPRRKTCLESTNP